MATERKISDLRPRLLFKSTCPPCRRLSGLAVLISLGTICRVPLDSDEARRVYARFPGNEGKPVLIDDQRAAFGWRVFVALPEMTMRAWLRATLYPVRDRMAQSRGGKL